MKTRIVIGGLLVSVLTLNVSAQQAENDDMYFKAKDREKLRAENAVASINDKIDNDYKAFKKKNFDEPTVEETATSPSAVNPTDSYSARTINPEYISRSNSAQAGEDEQTYYVEGYAPANTYDSYSGGTYNNYSNNLNPNYQNSWYGSSAYNSWYSPYYGYCNPYMSPYYSATPGWTMSLGYTWGNMYNPGMGFGMGYGWGSSYYNNPYYYNPYHSYSPYGYYGYPTYYNNGGYYSEASKPNYGKRPSRHSAVVTPTQQSRQRVATTNNGTPNGRSQQTADEYYVKPYKRSSSTFDNTTGGYTRDRYTSPTESASPTRTRESYNSNSRESHTTYSTPSRSSSGGSYTPSPSRSSSGSSSGSRSSRGRD